MRRPALVTLMLGLMTRGTMQIQQP